MKKQDLKMNKDNKYSINEYTNYDNSNLHTINNNSDLYTYHPTHFTNNENWYPPNIRSNIQTKTELYHGNSPMSQRRTPKPPRKQKPLTLCNSESEKKIKLRKGQYPFSAYELASLISEEPLSLENDNREIGNKMASTSPNEIKHQINYHSVEKHGKQKYNGAFINAIKDEYVMMERGIGVNGGMWGYEGVVGQPLQVPNQLRQSVPNNIKMPYSRQPLNNLPQFHDWNNPISSRDTNHMQDQISRSNQLLYHQLNIPYFHHTNQPMHTTQFTPIPRQLCLYNNPQNTDHSFYPNNPHHFNNINHSMQPNFSNNFQRSDQNYISNQIYNSNHPDLFTQSSKPDSKAFKTNTIPHSNVPPMQHDPQHSRNLQTHISTMTEYKDEIFNIYKYHKMNGEREKYASSSRQDNYSTLALI